MVGGVSGAWWSHQDGLGAHGVVDVQEGLLRRAGAGWAGRVLRRGAHVRREQTIKEMGFTNMTEIQHKSIRPLLEGRYG